MAPATVPSKEKQTQVSARKAKQRTLNSRRKASFARYIRKLVKQEHRGFSMSPEALPIINAVVNDIFERVAAEASRLSVFHGKPEITMDEIQAAVKAVLPGDVTKHMNLSS